MEIRKKFCLANLIYTLSTVLQQVNKHNNQYANRKLIHKRKILRVKKSMAIAARLKATQAPVFIVLSLKIISSAYFSSCLLLNRPVPKIKILTTLLIVSVTHL